MRYRTFIFDSARWSAFEPRAGDIIISTPPKCGTTWMQNIVAMLVLGTSQFDRPMAQLSPWLDQNLRPIASVLADLESTRHRRFVKSHTPLDGLPWRDEITYVVVGRDPRDVAMSWQHHWDNMDLERVMALRREAIGLDDLSELPAMPPPVTDPSERFWRWMTDRAASPEFATGLEFLVLHLRSFWERRHEPNVVMVHFADLLADLSGEMRRLADCLGVHVHDQQWPELVSAASFGSMSARADALAPNAGQIWRDTNAFFHAGSSGQWRAVAGQDGNRRYHEIIRTLSDDEAFLAWLHRGDGTNGRGAQ
jgi:aryl sulfotransferase